MKAKKTYLKGQSIFIVSLLVIVVTVLTVYLTGIEYNRSITANLYWSLSIIGNALFIFMTYGLYFGIGLKDNFPKFRAYKSGEYFGIPSEFPSFDMPAIATDDGISGIIISFVLWIAMAILFIVLLFVLEALFWVSIFIILAMLYWVFFRALRLVFSKSKLTIGNISLSARYAFWYTLLYLGWLFGIVVIIEFIRY